LHFRLTGQGATKFHALTRGLARRGARLRRNLAVAIEIDGRVRARPFVDYRLYPDGLDGSQGIEVQLPRALARRFAKQIRGR
jgi:hypothetical protein